MNTLKVVNRITYHTIESNLVYPNWTNKEEYLVLGILDSEYVEWYLTKEFSVCSISNKYAVLILGDILWYQHDKQTYILKQL